MEKLKRLLALYAMPIIVSPLIAMKEIAINGEPAGIIAKAGIGFVSGMAAEGLLIVLGVTFMILRDGE